MNTAGDEWQPATISIEGCPYCPIKVFSVCDKAVEHIREHLLDEREAAAWVCVLDPHGAVIDAISDPHSRNRLYHECGRQVEALRLLYEAYTKVIESNLRDACWLHWKYVERRGAGWLGVALGTCGLLMVAENGTIVTAFFPRQPEPDGPVRRGKRHMRGGTQPKESLKEYEARWTNEERIYYRVFRPAFRFVRAAQEEWFAQIGWLRPRNTDYALLKDKLPPVAHMTLVTWREYRKKCGH
ncbi:MAG: hypothetical protein KatS3mg110_0513 [Pirellulaceae bacterium]|nr:MAG: hypothetical protein KatS3mg110_0513 [Pirellulaceae bacterium]